MAYITQSDIESCYGVSNVRIWSNLENDSAVADTARIATAIAIAEEEVENAFRGGRVYAVPFVGTSAVLVNWIATIAGYWLYKSRPARGDAGDEYLDRVVSVRQEMQLYALGARRLPLTKVGTLNPSVPLLTTAIDELPYEPYGAPPPWGSDHRWGRGRPC
jgi:phage gp36-like protein